ncbi:MAG: septal ring lytic transglycosylase RlpA family protein [Actinomycetota bacterium]|nr:septal ring lytic transglycosylase RlpA family protein [Actinomycetota bacterium]
MLTVPASALALTGTVPDTHAATAGPTLQAQVNPRRLPVNHSAVVSGVAPADQAGHRVFVQTALRRQGSWQPLTSTEIRRGGHFRVRTRLRHSGYLRVVEGVALARAAAATTTATGAGAAAGPSDALPVAVRAQFRLARRSLSVLGASRMVVRGHLMPARGGRPVRVQGHFASGWRTLGRGRTGPAGGFRIRASAVGAVNRRLRVLFLGDRANARSVHAAGRVTAYRQDLASWYNDGGNTACGFHAGLGVANRTLACGTKVRFYNGGRTVTATVDDRGPYVGGRNWDLNQSTASALGFGGVGTIWVAR